MYQCSKSWSHIKNTVVLTILTFRHIQCLHLMDVEVARVLVSSGTEVQLQIILDPDYLPDYFSVFYDYGDTTFNSMAVSNVTTKPNLRFPFHINIFLSFLKTDLMSFL